MLPALLISTYGLKGISCCCQVSSSHPLLSPWALLAVAPAEQKLAIPFPRHLTFSWRLQELPATNRYFYLGKPQSSATVLWAVNSSV